jgi:protein involved in polysaccharide export with SLBB domain
MLSAMYTPARRVRRPGKGMLTSILIAAAVFWISISVGIWAGRRHVLNNPPPQPSAATATSPTAAGDQLQPGDRVELRLTDKAGVASAQSMTVDADGTITLPVFGKIKAQYLTPAQLEQAIARSYKERNLIPDGQMHVVRVPTTAPAR